MGNNRINSPALRAKVCDAQQAAELIEDGMGLGCGGFTPSGAPKAVSRALAQRAADAHAKGDPFAVRLFTGASTSPDLDGELARNDAISLRVPYNGDASLRDKINAGKTAYVDTHLSKVAPWARSGFFGDIDVAIVEATSIREDGGIVPTLSIGNNQAWLDLAKTVIVEVNAYHNPAIEGMHDIVTSGIAPNGQFDMPIRKVADRIGEPVLRVNPDKVRAVVLTDEPDLNAKFRDIDEGAKMIAGHLMEFFLHETRVGRLPSPLPPLQSGVGNVANAVMAAFGDGPFDNLVAYTEVIQDGMLAMLRSGKMLSVSGAAFAVSADEAVRVNADMEFLRERIVLRPQDVSNNPEVIRRLGCIAMNTMIEADIYGNVNSTRVMGSRVQNGIGGSGDFARAAHLSIFMAPSVAKGGSISAIVPMVSHVDHINQDVQVMVTEQGLADLRGLSARQRARAVIQNCAHPAYRPMLLGYLERAESSRYGGDTPHLLNEALGWHHRFLETGTMQPG
ncbi:succinate CoA transferase [Novosphingobium nitrogenifigens DSM 19370]|uniref:Succinate CoA transferase n=1 Tax=Novosphingobium nitrogenifigens DSM 19370 TaxID=983920 RepID=F1ZB52_9SPHN|nr:succinate CoA transferase [Novosphingobium nitrogenifigens]EGD58081.1 succinate CoA transferase [Novosphingobium nitrogenifigens DSM 19370]